MDRFVTSSSSKKNVITLILTFCVMAAVCALAALVNVRLFLFLEGVILFSALFLILLTVRVRFMIEFENSRLILTNTFNKRQFFLDGLYAKDFVIKQSGAQLKKDTCDMRLAGYPFAMYDISDAEKLRDYINKHYF